MDEQRQDDQLRPSYNSSVPIHDVALKTCQKRWTIEKGGWRGSGIMASIGPMFIVSEDSFLRFNLINKSLFHQ